MGGSCPSGPHIVKVGEGGKGGCLANGLEGPDPDVGDPTEEVRTSARVETLKVVCLAPRYHSWWSRPSKLQNPSL